MEVGEAEVETAVDDAVGVATVVDEPVGAETVGAALDDVVVAELLGLTATSTLDAETSLVKSDLK